MERTFCPNFRRVGQDALIKLTGDCNASVPANSTENEALIGRPHLRGAREVWLVATANVCFRGAHVAAAFLTIKLIGNVSPEFPAPPAPPGKVFARLRLSCDWSHRGEIYFA